MWHRQTDVFPHEILWIASQSALRAARIVHPDISAVDLTLQGLLSGFLAFEGFINFVGMEVAPTVWRKERKFFGKLPFIGLPGKIEYLVTQFPNISLVKSEEPYLTFSMLKGVRDSLAHSSPDRSIEVTSNELPSFSTQWDAFQSPDEVERHLSRLKEFAETIRREALRTLREEYPLSHLNYPAFEEPRGGSTGERRNS